jgi:hypothetical protein
MLRFFRCSTSVPTPPTGIDHSDGQAAACTVSHVFDVPLLQHVNLAMNIRREGELRKKEKTIAPIIEATELRVPSTTALRIIAKNHLGKTR